MDIYYELNEITFVWNEEKAQKNISKHGIPFEQATEAFFDPFLIFVDTSDAGISTESGSDAGGSASHPGPVVQTGALAVILLVSPSTLHPYRYKVNKKNKILEYLNIKAPDIF